MSIMTHSRLLLAILGIAGVIGCSSDAKIVPVSGSVKFPDGTVPTGEVAIVQFGSANREDGKLGTKPASGDIKADGSFQLTTSSPGDGAFEGDYQVTFHVVRKYGTNDYLVDKKYTETATTPHKAKVERGKKNHFDFVVEKPAG
jgi:hypothetical protein